MGIITQPSVFSEKSVPFIYKSQGRQISRKLRSLSVLLMFCPAQSERYFYSVPLNTAVSFETKQNESIFNAIPSQEGLLFVLV